MYSALVCLLFGLVLVCHADWRIINGKNAIMNEFPSIVSLKYINSIGHFCGGSLIDKRTVLTAAHCVYDYRFETEEQHIRYGLVAVMGEHQLDKLSSKERIIPVKKIIVHPDYVEGKYFLGNDIALVRLVEDVVEEDHIRIAKFPAQDEEPTVGQTCTVAGWGAMKGLGHDTSNILQKVNLQILSNEVCSAKYKHTLNNMSNVCARGTSEKASCRGDSGGPLYCKQPDGSVIQVGAVSYGLQYCGLLNAPSVFTRVSHYSDWIKSHL